MRFKLTTKILVLAEIYGDCRAEGLSALAERFLERLEHIVGEVSSMEQELEKLTNERKNDKVEL